MSATFWPAGANVLSAQPAEGEITHQTVREVLLVHDSARTDSRTV